MTSLLDKTKPRIILVNELVMRFNLAVGDYLFKSEKPTLFIGKPMPAVIFGRNQNPYLECNLEAIKHEHLIRRTSGGGVIYGDNGTLMVGFYGRTDYPNFNKNNINEIIGKNDIKILMNGVEQKIAGQAYRIENPYYLHHLAISVGTNMDNLIPYLKPNELKMKSKGTESVRSNVMNMIDIATNHNSNKESMCYDLAKQIANNYIEYFQVKPSIIIITENPMDPYFEIFKSLDPKYVSYEELLEVDAIKTTYDKLCNKHWIFGQNPEFTNMFEQRFQWGTVRIELLVRNNIIENVQCYTDSICVNVLDELKSILIGTFYSKNDISDKFKSVDSDKEVITYRLDSSPY